METKKPGERGDKEKEGEGSKGLVCLTALQTKKSWSYIFKVFRGCRHPFHMCFINSGKADETRLLRKQVALLHPAL